MDISIGNALLLFALLFFGVASCSRDTRPLDVRIRKALTERLQQYDVKGASVAAVSPDGKRIAFASGQTGNAISTLWN